MRDESVIFKSHRAGREGLQQDMSWLTKGLFDLLDDMKHDHEPWMYKKISWCVLQLN